MSENFAGWVPDADVPGEVPTSPTAAVPSWLPPGVARRLAFEDVAEARAARAAERERADHAEALRDRALIAYRDDAERRGEYVSAIALATGQVPGRTLGDVFRDAIEAGDRDDARLAARDRNQEWLGAGEPVFRSRYQGDGWPESAYIADSQIARAQELHRDLVAYRARRNFAAAEQAARARGSHSGNDLERARSGHSGYASQGEITRGVENAITGVW